MLALRLSIVGSLAALLSGCGPDFELECRNGAPVIDDAPFTCAECFEALGCEGAAESVPDCPTGITGSCSVDVVGQEYCCEGECIDCP